MSFFFFFNDTATTEIYTLSLHDALPISELVCHASRELHMKLIAVFTHSGFTARLVSRYRPLVPIVAFSPEAETRRRMARIWGALPRIIQDVRKADGLAKVADKRLLEERLGRT